MQHFSKLAVLTHSRCSISSKVAPSTINPNPAIKTSGFSQKRNSSSDALGGLPGADWGWRQSEIEQFVPKILVIDKKMCSTPKNCHKPIPRPYFFTISIPIHMKNVTNPTPPQNWPKPGKINYNLQKPFHFSPRRRQAEAFEIVYTSRPLPVDWRRSPMQCSRECIWSTGHPVHWGDRAKSTYAIFPHYIMYPPYPHILYGP